MPPIVSGRTLCRNPVALAKLLTRISWGQRLLPRSPAVGDAFRVKCAVGVEIDQTVPLGSLLIRPLPPVSAHRPAAHERDASILATIDQVQVAAQAQLHAAMLDEEILDPPGVS